MRTAMSTAVTRRARIVFTRNYEVRPLVYCYRLAAVQRLDDNSISPRSLTMPDDEARLCDVCHVNPAVGECCCGIAYCGAVCQETHLDKVHEEDEDET